MKTPIIATLMVALTTGVAAGHTVIKNDLRAPAYPLITIDPYTSAWSAADNLYDAPVTHWTAKDFPFIGVVKVDGTPYRFMGIEQQEMKAIVPTSEQGDWTGRWTTETPAAGWNTPDFNDSAWKSDRGAFGTQENEPTARTQWGTRNIWVRRTVQINPADIAGRQVYLEFSNDDDAVFYINGVKIFNTGSTCNKNKVVKLNDEAMAAIKPGKNLIAAECINPVGNGLLDFGLSVPRDLHTVFEKTATQTSADVQATHMAADGDHYRLTFDKPGTWSQKYNIVWDKLLGFNVFGPEIMDTEIKYYLTRQNQYGLPLDNRETYTKTEWIMWTATMTDNQADFDSFIKPVHKFFNETVDRVPISDWVFTDKPNRRGFMTRAVVGGYFIKMLDKQRNKK